MFTSIISLSNKKWSILKYILYCTVPGLVASNFFCTTLLFFWLIIPIKCWILIKGKYINNP